MLSEHFFYLITGDNTYYKVGQTENFNARLKTYNNNVPLPYKPIYVGKTTKEKALLSEKVFTLLNKNYRYSSKREWFKFIDIDTNLNSSFDMNGKRHESFNIWLYEVMEMAEITNEFELQDGFYKHEFGIESHRKSCDVDRTKEINGKLKYLNGILRNKFYNKQITLSNLKDPNFMRPYHESEAYLIYEIIKDSIKTKVKPDEQFNVLDERIEQAKEIEGSHCSYPFKMNSKQLWKLIDTEWLDDA